MVLVDELVVLLEEEDVELLELDAVVELEDDVLLEELLDDERGSARVAAPCSLERLADVSSHRRENRRAQSL